MVQHFAKEIKDAQIAMSRGIVQLGIQLLQEHELGRTGTQGEVEHWGEAEAEGEALQVFDEDRGQKTSAGGSFLVLEGTGQSKGEVGSRRFYATYLFVLLSLERDVSGR